MLTLVLMRAAALLLEMEASHVLDPEYTRDVIIRQILKSEGGYVNDARDPGGETNYGISKRHHPDEDIKNMTPDRAKEIYTKDYWDVIQADKLPAPLAVIVTDHAVNAGPARAIRMLQELVGAEADGVVGPITIRLAKAFWSRNGTNTIKWYNKARIRYYRRLPGWAHFGDGWVHRVLEAEVLAVSWANVLALLDVASQHLKS